MNNPNELINYVYVEYIVEYRYVCVYGLRCYRNYMPEFHGPITQRKGVASRSNLAVLQYRSVDPEMLLEIKTDRHAQSSNEISRVTCTTQYSFEAHASREL